MKKALFCIFALFACVGIFAQQQPVVAVAPFDAISGISAAEANMITRVFFIRLGNTNTVRLVDRNVVDRVLREHNFQAGDWSNQQKTAELGTALNADWIVRGELETFGSSILVTVQFYDIRTFQFMGGSDVRIANAEAAYDNMDPLVNRLVETIASSGRQPGSNTGASAYYGTWLQRGSDWTISLILESNRVTFRHSNGNYIVLSNPTWSAVNNQDVNRLADYPSGFRIFGTATDIRGYSETRNFLPIFVFLHRSDNNRMLFYNSPASASEVQDNAPRNPDQGAMGRVQ